jgi:hypothetical protein
MFGILLTIHMQDTEMLLTQTLFWVEDIYFLRF